MGLTSNIDLAEILFTLFWLFFIGLLYYLHRESKREGYPLESDRSGAVTVQGFPAVPEPKTYDLTHGGTKNAPDANEEPQYELKAEPAAPHPGAPLVPTGNPMVDGVGPAAYALRANHPDTTIDGKPRIVPLRTAEGFHVDSRDPDPRGMPVVCADGETAGTVSDVWVDLVEPMICFFEVDVAGENPRKALLPIGFAKVNKRAGRIDVQAVHARHFADVPATAADDQITCREEDRIMGYFAGGTLYADESRQEPWF